MNDSIEQGPIRPPSEAQSLLIRATRNCPWNKCTFCHTYRGTRFELRSLEDIEQDVQKAADAADAIKRISWEHGDAGNITANVVNAIMNDSRYGDLHRGVASWLYFGGQSVFLQDGNSLVMKTEDLVSLLQFIKAKFPGVNRITSYCRAKTAAKKTVEEFKKLHEAGLTRIHIGMETGYDPLLSFIHKGVTAAEHITGGRNIKMSGISLSEYIMPGLGGTRWSKEHAIETARVLNQIDPDYIRLRTFQPVPGTEIYDLIEKGELALLDEDAIVREIRLFIETLDGITSRIVSDHILNLLEEIEGKFPEDKGKLLETTDKYLNLADEDRVIYALGRRYGLYRRLDDLEDLTTYNDLKRILASYQAGDPGRLQRDLARVRRRFL